MILLGVHSIENTLIMTFDFHPIGPRGYPWGPRVCQILMLHKTKGEQRLILVAIMKNVEIPDFGHPPSQPCLLTPFSRAMGRKSKFRSQHFFALPSCYRKSMTQPPCPKPWEEIDLAEKSVIGVLA